MSVWLYQCKKMQVKAQSDVKKKKNKSKQKTQKNKTTKKNNKKKKKYSVFDVCDPYCK